jgi:hypothetical protein
MQRTHADPGQSNAEFLLAHAGPARIGLAGGDHPLDRSIRRAQRLLTKQGDSAWSHAFVFGTQRSDDQWWVFESDIDVRHKQIRLGAQENRLAKFFDRHEWPNLAVLDFGLDDMQERRVLASALELLANATRYSLREIVGTALALARPTLRGRENLLAREGSLYCSAFVQHCYGAIDIAFVGGVSTKNTTPHDIASSKIPHAAHLLVRETGVLG